MKFQVKKILGFQHCPKDFKKIKKSSFNSLNLYMIVYIFELHGIKRFDAIFVAVILFKLFMWLLPVIVVVLIAFFIYVYLSERY